MEIDEEWADFEEEIQVFVVYFRKTWIKRRGGNSAFFAPNLWNQYETILQGGVQTNNMLESYNRTNVCFGQTLLVRTFVETQTGSRRPWTTFKGSSFFVTSFNTTPPQEYFQMIGHELQQEAKYKST